MCSLAGEIPILTGLDSGSPSLLINSLFVNRILICVCDFID